MIADKSSATPASGYLSRSLAMGLSPIEIVMDDCGTNDFLNVNIISEKHKKTLIGKYYLNNQTNQIELITKENVNDLIVGRDVKIRSLITCEAHNDKICRVCFGDKQYPTKYLGILSAQIVSSVLTQLTMRYHIAPFVSNHKSKLL